MQVGLWPEGALSLVKHPLGGNTDYRSRRGYLEPKYFLVSAVSYGAFGKASLPVRAKYILYFITYSCSCSVSPLCAVAPPSSFTHGCAHISLREWGAVRCAAVLAVTSHVLPNTSVAVHSPHLSDLHFTTAFLEKPRKTSLTASYIGQLRRKKPLDLMLLSFFLNNTRFLCY